MNDDEAIVAALTEIGIIQQLVDTEMRLALAPALSVSEFGVLSHFIRRPDPVEPGRLARAFQQAKSSMTATLAKLERKGLVKIDPDPEDGRKKLASLTDEGRKAWMEGVASTTPLREKLKAGFGADQLRTILPALSSLRAWLDEARNERDGF
ncbi:MarR family transcriptional regulator [Parvularcula sp. ZS-1/3]|uniref:MarR family transcriptional regulator n=1 Tax=Parvularcula mediterranea TaxID=2732508 RepID=A0A7Y3W4I4_9PROT|nr:MarR family transcriptional regulator [Parvularcula mediterranea]NNU15276.1 MarR family transcriptional regulator [Parvularcula mediterranea]